MNQVGSLDSSRDYNPSVQKVLQIDFILYSMYVSKFYDPNKASFVAVEEASLRQHDGIYINVDGVLAARALRVWRARGV